MAFHNNLDLRVVDLSANPNLHEVKPFAFPRILQLSHLNLAGSSLSGLRSDAVPWERLGFLDLSDVWLVCDCDLGWMMRVPVRGARCESPPALRSVYTMCTRDILVAMYIRGSLLKSLSPAQLGCGPGLQTEVMVVGLGCVALVALVLVISSLCCLCRNKLRLLASTCAVSAQESSYKVTQAL